MSEFEDLIDSEPPAIDPYEVLEIEREATAEEVKASRKREREG